MGKYASSPLWSDTNPIPLSDDATGENSTVQPLATIAYAPSYSEAMSYLRAVMASNEFSQRALELTADIISMNPAHYTVWLYRARILKELKMDVMGELKWLEGVARRNLKNYQIWHHRQTLITTLPTLPSSEPDFLTSVLALDVKNYHVWTYRQWLCTRFPAALLNHPAELRRTEQMIDDDIRNNSAWHHRWFLRFGAEDLRAAGSEGLGGLKGLAAGGGGAGVVDEELVETELEYAMGKARLAPQNPSPWNYLRGILRRAGRPLSDLESFCLEFLGVDGNVERETDEEKGIAGVRSSHAVEWLGEIWGTQGDLERARRCWDVLGEKWDPVRKGYWDYRRGRLEEAAREGHGAGFGGGSGGRVAIGAEG